MNHMMTFPGTVEEFMEQYKMVDHDHVYSNGTEYVPIFRMKQWFEHLDAVPKTNADRIRGKDDESLADFFDNEAFLAPWCDLSCDDVEETPCRQCILKWLKQEAET